MTLLGIDLGTTHSKAGLFDLSGRSLYVASRVNTLHHDEGGFACYDAREMWAQVQAIIQEALDWQQGHCAEQVQAIGVASMAESGLLVERRSGEGRSGMLAWFDPLASAQADYLRAHFGVKERFLASGLRLSFKCSLAKILWLRQQEPALLEGAGWLNAADYVAYRLSGAMATEASLGGRSGALRIDTKAWDGDLLAELGLDVSVFPRLLPSGAPCGGLRDELARPGLLAGIPIAVCGHDHICAAFAAEAVLGRGTILDSMGTAESLVGRMEKRRLGEAEWQSGFSIGWHVHPGALYWASGLSTSGGAIEWLRGLLGDPPLSYADLENLLEQAPDRPGEVLFIPYLAGSGAPHNDPGRRGAFVGLSAAHGRADLYRGVLEGTAYEMEYARQRASELNWASVQQLAVTGGGTRNRRWLQMKADISGCRVKVLPEEQATALGAALLAGLGCGVYAGWEQMAGLVQRPAQAIYLPRDEWREAYQERHRRFVSLVEGMGGQAKLEALQGAAAG